MEDFDNAIKKLEGFGLSFTELIEKKEDGIKIAFSPIGDTSIELVSFSPGKAWGPMHTIVCSQKGAINHLCFEVDNLESTINDFEKQGARLVEDCPRAGAHGRVAFFYPETTHGVLIELCEV